MMLKALSNAPMASVEGTHSPGHSFHGNLTHYPCAAHRSHLGVNAIMNIDLAGRMAVVTGSP
jgi:hypothetical protein